VGVMARSSCRAPEECVTPVKLDVIATGRRPDLAGESSRRAASEPVNATGSQQLTTPNKGVIGLSSPFTGAEVL